MSIKGIGLFLGLTWPIWIMVLSRIYDDPKPQLEYSQTVTTTFTLSDGTQCIRSTSGFAGTVTSCQ